MPENHFPAVWAPHALVPLVPSRHTKGEESWWLRPGQAARPSREGDALRALPAHMYAELTLKNTPQTDGCCAVAAQVMQ